MAKKEVKKVAITKKVAPKKKKRVVAPKVMVKVKATYNNTIVSVVDYEGNVLAASSCGAIGFSGSKKSTAYAATKAGEEACIKAYEMGAREAEVVVKGIGIGRQAAIKGVRAAGLRITTLSDHTAVPHGGCKPRRQPKK
jgi:small subunit ribosomal protein S11